MIENLYELGFTDKFINEMINKLGYDDTLNLSCNIPLIKANINILNLFDINNIKELILYNPNIFLINPEKLLKNLNMTNKEIFAKLVNEDITIIDDLLN